jgi:hypothetical protein
MKQYPWKFKLSWDGIQWYQTEATLGTDKYFYYFHWCRMDEETRDLWRKEPDGVGTIGLHRFWYEQPHAQLNLYYINFYWSTPWTKPPEEYRRKK